MLERLCAMVLSMAFLSACSSPDIFVQEKQYFDEQVAGKEAIEQLKIERPGFSLQYARSGQRAATAVVYIHGTPGGWGNAARYLMDGELQRRAYMVSIDRPGWGGSRGHDQQEQIRFSRQAAQLKPLLEKVKAENGGRGVILLGHSLGASLAPYIAMEYPQLVDGMILLAGSLDPELGKPRWYNLAASMGVVSWFLSPEMRNANREIMPLHAHLEAMRQRWPDITMPVTVIQGLKDRLVYPGNADFAERELINADLKVLKLPEAGHLLPWENRALVKHEVLTMVEKLDARNL